MRADRSAVRFAEVLRRLSQLPDPLPDAPRELAPVLLAGPGGAPGIAVPWPDGRVREGAVLVLLYPDDEGSASVVLTERSSGGHRHAGEVSFPGGVVDADDASPIAAALREAREEVGLDAEEAGVRVIGRLDAVEVRASGFRLLPVLAVADRRPNLRRDEREVAAIMEVPVRHFLPGAPIEVVTTERAGRRLRYGAYPVGPYRIWGATARVLGQLGALLAARAPSPSPEATGR